MDVGAWATISRLLDEALDLPEAERAGWLARLGPEHAPLVPRLRAMLARATTDDDGFLAALPPLSAMGDGGDGLRMGAGDAGELVGQYRLVRELASGGQGSVWLAERADGRLTRPVAVKLPIGLAFRPHLAERMAREGQILASLTHPHIARLYDAGVTADGAPFLAMEYVDGAAIDQHCAAQGLDVAARVRLFVPVVRAVAFAHARLVIHRDLKPSNILVTADGDARLLDFGIAKLLDEARPEASTLTTEGGRAMTLRYASPEQVAQQPLGVATDVYSLGVVLYELLTGVAPYRPARDTVAALEEAVLSAEPRRPSDAADAPAERRALRGDLDTILLKALKKDPAARYVTAGELADDLTRYLDGRPVVAQPDRRGYRIRKFVGRHRLEVAAAATALAAVLAGAGIAVWQAQVARAEQQRAESEQRRAEDVKQFIASIFEDADPYAGGGANVKAVDLLAQARGRLDAIPRTQAATRVELLAILGGSLLRLQDIDGAESAITQAVDEGRASLGDEHPLTLTARLSNVHVLRYRGDVAGMRREIDALVPTLEGRGDAGARDLIVALEQRAHMELDAGNYAASEQATADALRRADAVLGPRDQKTVSLAMMLAQTYQFGTPRPVQALEAAERAMQLVSSLYPDEPTYPMVVDMRHIYARALGGAGQFARGIEELERAIRDASVTVGPDGQKVAFMRSNLARIQRKAGRIADALENHAQSRAVLGRQFALDSWSYLGGVVSEGQSHLAARHAEAARRDLALAVEGLSRTMGPDHQQVVTARHNLELARAYGGEAAGAVEALRALSARYAPPDPAMRAPLLLSLGTAQRLAGLSADAIATLDEAREAFGTGVATELERTQATAEIGLAQLALGRFDEARRTLTEALDGFRRIQIAPTPARAEVQAGLAQALAGLGQRAAASPDGLPARRPL